eukprot:Nk52_evm13s272 gene=Nk52_evmTU13s272
MSRSGGRTGAAKRGGVFRSILSSFGCVGGGEEKKKKAPPPQEAKGRQDQEEVWVGTEGAKRHVSSGSTGSLMNPYYTSEEHVTTITHLNDTTWSDLLNSTKTGNTGTGVSGNEGSSASSAQVTPRGSTGSIYSSGSRGGGGKVPAMSGAPSYVISEALDSQISAPRRSRAQSLNMKVYTEAVEQNINSVFSGDAFGGKRMLSRNSTGTTNSVVINNQNNRRLSSYLNAIAGNRNVAKKLTETKEEDGPTERDGDGNDDAPKDMAVNSSDADQEEKKDEAINMSTDSNSSEGSIVVDVGNFVPEQSILKVTDKRRAGGKAAISSHNKVVGFVPHVLVAETYNMEDYDRNAMKMKSISDKKLMKLQKEITDLREELQTFFPDPSVNWYVPPPPEFMTKSSEAAAEEQEEGTFFEDNEREIGLGVDDVKVGSTKSNDENNGDDNGNNVNMSLGKCFRCGDTENMKAHKVEGELKILCTNCLEIADRGSNDDNTRESDFDDQEGNGSNNRKGGDRNDNSKGGRDSSTGDDEEDDEDNHSQQVLTILENGKSPSSNSAKSVETTTPSTPVISV